MMSALWTPPAMQLACRAGAFYCVDKQDDGWLEEIGALVGAWEAGQHNTLDASDLALPTLDEVRDSFVQGMLGVCGRNVSATADVMDVQRSSLQRSLRAAREREEMRQTESDRLRTAFERVDLTKRKGRDRLED